MVVFLHGWGMNRHIFQKFVDSYLGDDEYLLLNLPGYGDSCQQGLDFEAQVGLLKGDIAEGSHIVAWSLAGLYALRLSSLFPNHLSKLTMVCSTPSFVQKDNFTHALTADVLQQFSDQLILDRDKTIERFLLLQLHGQSQIKKAVKAIRADLVKQDSPSLQVLEFGLHCLKAIDARNDLRKCRIPIRFILGEKDKLVPCQVEASLKELNKTCDIKILKGVAHLPFITHQELFHEAVFG